MEHEALSELLDLLMHSCDMSELAALDLISRLLAEEAPGLVPAACPSPDLYIAQLR